MTDLSAGGRAGATPGDVGGRTYGTRMIECVLCGTDATVLDRSGSHDTEPELVVLCADCTPSEVTEALETALLEPAHRSHARAA
ncbi:hypothetical protein C5C31_05730 [Rathayibacter rathayi]|nr:hypothetical protein C5C02_11120 [Rathayibacter rathayi]PPG78151.1 hypothetical protein C5C23_03760 [Rathayibacter rathayi]PPH24615.1 hypothetical protein C5C31_05730 [Rathayibacter rathayi]PPI77547.1 hypothetical protein C5E03_03590 [Rathayibacter rathayi]